MHQQPSAMKLTEEVLVLHPGILKVFMLEERADRFVVVEESARPGVGQLAYEVDQSLKSGALNPARILEAAAEFNKNLGVPRLVGVLYGNGGVMFTYTSPYRLLAICAEASRFHEALWTVNGALPTLMGELEVGLMPVDYVKSAAEAAEIARNYVATAGKSPEVSVDEVTLNQARRMWEIRGSHRTFPFARSRRFQLQLGAQNGVVMGFVSTPKPSLAPLLTGIGVILGTLLFLALLISLNR